MCECLFIAIKNFPLNPPPNYFSHLHYVLFFFFPSIKSSDNRPDNDTKDTQEDTHSCAADRCDDKSFHSGVSWVSVSMCVSVCVRSHTVSVCILVGQLRINCSYSTWRFPLSSSLLFSHNVPLY